MKFPSRSPRVASIASVATAIKRKGASLFAAAVGATVLVATGAQAANVRLSFGHPESYAL